MRVTLTVTAKLLLISWFTGQKIDLNIYKNLFAASISLIATLFMITWMFILGGWGGLRDNFVSQEGSEALFW